jgi:MATE family multidrug resistance protein
MLSFIPLVGMNISVMSLIGRFVGMGDMGRANQVISSGFILSLAYAGVLVVVFLVFRMDLVNVFRTPGTEFDAIAELAGQMMIGLCTYMLADALIMVAGGTLRGAGDTRWVMVTSITLHWLMVVAQYYAVVELKLEPLVSWWILVGMILSLALAYMWRLLGGRWRQPDRLAAVMRE